MELDYGVPTDKCAVTVRLGIQKGFFRDEGIDLSVRVVFGGPPLAAAYDSGQLQFGEIGSPPGVAAISRGADFKIVGSGRRLGLCAAFSCFADTEYKLSFGIAAVGPDDLQSSEHLDQRFDQGLGGIPILHGRRGDHNSQDQAQNVHHHMAFAPFDLFTRIVAALSGLIGRFDRLAVNNGRCGSHLPPFGITQPIAQRVVDEGPSPILTPLAKVAIDGLPGAEVFGKKPPRTARSNHIKDGVDQDAAVLAERASALARAGLGCRHQRFDLVPFFISQIRWITYRMRLHPIHLYPTRSLYNFNVIVG